MPTLQSSSRQFHLITTILFPNRLDIPFVKGIDDPLFTPYDLEVGD